MIDGEEVWCGVTGGIRECVIWDSAEPGIVIILSPPTLSEEALLILFIYFDVSPKILMCVCICVCFQ